MLVMHEGVTCRNLIGAVEMGDQLSRMGEQGDAVRANRGDDAMDFDELCVKAAVDQLIPGRLDGNRQFAVAKSRCLPRKKLRRKLARVCDAFDLEEISQPWRILQNGAELTDVNSAGCVLNHQRIGVRQITGDDTTEAGRQLSG